MKAVIKSVSTEIFEKIVAKKCSILDSKTTPNCETPFKVYVYCNKAKTQWRYSAYEGAYQNSDGEIICAQQRVACEFVCNNTNGGWHISDLKIYDKPKELSEFYKPCPDPYRYCTICKHCVKIIPPDEEEYALYHGGHYDYCEEHCTNGLAAPPRGWQYVEELEDEI